AVKKPVVKKPVKKAVKKPVAKKPVKKAVKKPVAKKPAKKPVKKTTTKKPANKAVKHVTMADKYQPTVKDVTLNWGESFDPRDAITNAPGYFPHVPDPEHEEDPFLYPQESYFGYVINGFAPDPYNRGSVGHPIFIYRPGTYDAQIEVNYPDGSYEKTKRFKITVLPSDADKAKVSLKSSNFTVSSNETLEHEQDSDWAGVNGTLNDPTRFLNIGSALPKGTIICFDDSLDSIDKPKPGKYVTSLSITFPDGSVYRTDKFTVNVK
ncbi:Rib/alpha-like domain-containing protein, partial [Lactobacillus delbrueckii]|uniref:Rib/alpha-like domain-containing protein n=1 Tax=Lactobacillus delbrueckii TaxID=1584 RepID=UPI003A88885C